MVGSCPTTRRRLVVWLALKMAEIDCEFIFGDAGVSGPGWWCHLGGWTLEVKMKMKMGLEDTGLFATNSSWFGFKKCDDVEKVCTLQQRVQKCGGQTRVPMCGVSLVCWISDQQLFLSARESLPRMLPRLFNFQMANSYEQHIAMLNCECGSV